MKKLFFLFVLFSVLLTVITACTSDDTSTLPQSSGDIPENDITLSGEGTSSSEDPSESGQKPEDTQAPGTEAPVISLSFSMPSGMDSYAVTGIGNLTDTHIEIPATYNGLPVTQIAEKAFYQNTHIASLTLPDSVTSIGASAFDGCTALKTLNLGAVKELGAYAFARCGALETVVLPESTNTVGDGLFFSCSSLKSVTLPRGIQKIGSFFFSYCKNLSSVNSGDCNSLQSIDMHAFYNCTSLKYIVIPASVTSIHDDAFEGCTWLSSVYLDRAKTSSLGNGWYDKSKTHLYWKGEWQYDSDGVPHVSGT